MKLACPVLAALALGISLAASPVGDGQLHRDLLAPGRPMITPATPLAERVAKAERGDAEALAWLGRAADQGDAACQHALGRIHSTGTGVPLDTKAGVAWFRRAAAQGYAPSVYAIGVCYGQARGVALDDREEFMWFKKAAELGYADAQRNLALCYAIGQGTKRDMVEAYVWFEVWAANPMGGNGKADVETARNDAASRLDPRAIAGARRKARRLVQAIKAWSVTETGSAQAPRFSPGDSRCSSKGLSVVPKPRVQA